MLAKSAITRRLTGHVLLAIFVTLLEIQWKDVEQEWTKLIGGMFQKVMPVNVVTNKLVGDAKLWF